MSPETAAAKNPEPSRHCDVLIVGGGPAGSTAATLLARQGRSVLLVEKAQHPRFHIGESLLPAGVPLLEQLGVRAQVEAIGMPKWGVEFCSPQHQHKTFVEFGDAWDKAQPMAWQVRRDAFDEILFRNAAAAGAHTLEACRVLPPQFDAEGATAQLQHDDGRRETVRARFVIDASGRDTLLAMQQGWKQKNRRHNSAALFAHFRGAERLPGKLEGNISIFWFQHGWFWFIPLADGSTSVGAVCWPGYLKQRDKPLKDFFLDTVALAPELAQRLAGATLVDEQVWATGNYSYSARQCSGERFLLLGDAFAFIDPVFSSGVFLAMQSAFEGVDVVNAALEQPARLPAARRRFERRMRHGPREFSWFIHRMTNPMMRELFMHPRNPLRMQEAVLSLLAGDIYRRTPIWASLAAFKGVYYLGSLFTPLRTLRAWRTRRQLVRDAGPLRGENVVSPQA